MTNSDFCYKLEKAFHAYLKNRYRTRNIRSTFFALLNQFQSFDHETQTKIFNDMRFNLSPCNGIFESISSRTGLAFKLSDLTYLWEFMVRRFDVFKSFTITDSHQRKQIVYPIDIMVEYDVDFQNDHGFTNLIGTIYDYQLLLFKIFYKRNTGTLLTKCCEYPTPHIHSLRKLISILTNMALHNPDFKDNIRKYVNHTDINGSNCLDLLNKFANKTDYSDEFNQLIELGVKQLQKI